MVRFRVKRGNINRADSERALLTDTSPADVPIIFSNDGFHENLRRHKSAPLTLIASALIQTNSERYTIPYRYRIRLSNTASRQISLAHPAAQYRASQFYQRYGHLIPYFCRHADVSLRRPTKIGSTLFYLSSSSEKKKYKGAAIDLLVDDQRVRHPGSFFTYAEHDRFYKFFGSQEFIQLEKSFSMMRTTDISKCFSSIYSHTLAWAVKDVQHGKENTSAVSFANEFDALMQFSNYNETNGIPVGAKVSRLFAEIILQAVDISLIRRAEHNSLQHGKDFVVRRYIDDYVVFANEIGTLDAIQRGLSEALQTFNLHLNELKTNTIFRPLQTRRSQIIAAATSGLATFREHVSVYDSERHVYFPSKIRNAKAVFVAFVNEMKVACVNAEASYDDISPYVVGAICKTIDSLIEASGLARPQDKHARDYFNCFHALLLALFYFFTVHVTVPTSYQVARSSILSVRFFRKKLPEYADEICEIIRSLVQDVTSNPALQNVTMSDYVPIEVLNIILASSELPREYQTNVRTIRERALKSDRIDYFTIVSLLFYFGHDDRDFVVRLQKKIVHEFLPKISPRRDSHDAHFILDLIACPYIDIDVREQLLLTLTQDLGVVALFSSKDIVQEMEANPWFVNWKQIDLLNHLRKKELSPVY
jgi:hypothetical protein